MRNKITKPILRRYIILVIALCAMLACTQKQSINLKVDSSKGLHFNKLSKVWDEAIPLGNGMVGALIWEKDGKLRFSLDRADLWDLRPMENLKTPKWKYSWVYEQWKKDDYKPVQDLFDAPYGKAPAPSKIPGAALEFDISSLGDVESVVLDANNAICKVKWKNGVKLLTFVHATKPIGWYRFEGLKEELPYNIIPPAYNTKQGSNSKKIEVGQSLKQLGYPQGSISKNKNAITYNQEGWGGFKYQVHTNNTIKNGVLEGGWSISSEYPSWKKTPSAKDVLTKAMVSGMPNILNSHKKWWSNFWNKSDIKVPDSILQKQWYLEQYKFGSAARKGAPPISLQAVWTADNGNLPPWKGDFHHDLNTQLSYWPSYSGNHLDQEIGFIDWLWTYKETFKAYTKAYYESEGINVPGVSTLTGEPMGGWIQYAFGPTVSAWLGHNFYMHWRYSMDKTFLEQKAYPWIKGVAIYLENITQIGANGIRKLPISSSPEIHNNNREAWFGSTTNFDLALIRWTYEKANELALELGKDEEAKKWAKILSEWPELAANDDKGLLLAPGADYTESHRHLSHQLGYHPLGIIDFSKGKKHEKIINNTIATIDEVGSANWVGYSFSWLGNLKARAFDGEGAAKVLRIFATSFCLPNSFHVNGDQSGKGYSERTYRPFTLEGNFAFAAGLQEMLIQSHTGIVHLFPAIPKDWKDVSFKQLRTEGAFLISAIKEKGKTVRVTVKSEKGGIIKLKNPFSGTDFNCSKDYKLENNNTIVVETTVGELITFSN